MARLSFARQIAMGVTLAAGALVVSDSTVQAQEGRMRVLVPNFEVENNPRSRTGERIASDVKRHINQLDTHAPVEDRAVRDALRRYSLNANEMSCIQWRQLGQQVNAGLVLCGTVNESTNQVNAAFYNVGGDAFEVPTFTMESPNQAAGQVVQAFGTYVRQLSLVLYCNEDLESENWEQALTRCTEASQLNPRSVSAQYGRGSALSQMERHEEALEAFRRVLEIDQLNQDAMLHSGIITARLGRTEESQQYFRDYLALNPGSEEVRLKVATDLANAGDPAGALSLLEETIQGGEASGTMVTYAGHFAMNAGLRATEAGEVAGSAEDAARFYRTAIQYYDRAMTAVPADSLDATVYRNLMLAHSRLGNEAEAIRFGQQATTARADDANTWMVYADVLATANRMDEALRAFDRAQQIDPDLPNISARRAVMLLQGGRLQEAAAAARQGLQRGDLSTDIAESLAQQMAVRGFQASQQNRHGDALPFYSAAREIGRSQRTVGMINFFNGYTLVRQGFALVGGENANAARARQAKPLLEQGRTMLEGSSAYTEQASTRAQLIQQANQLIEVADALIRAGR